MRAKDIKVSNILFCNEDVNLFEYILIRRNDADMSANYYDFLVSLFNVLNVDVYSEYRKFCGIEDLIERNGVLKIILSRDDFFKFLYEYSISGNSIRRDVGSFILRFLGFVKELYNKIGKRSASLLFDNFVSNLKKSKTEYDIIYYCLFSFLISINNSKFSSIYNLFSKEVLISEFSGQIFYDEIMFLRNRIDTDDIDKIKSEFYDGFINVIVKNDMHREIFSHVFTLLSAFNVYLFFKFIVDDRDNSYKNLCNFVRLCDELYGYRFGVRLSCCKEISKSQYFEIKDDYESIKSDQDCFYDFSDEFLDKYINYILDIDKRHNNYIQDCFKKDYWVGKTLCDVMFYNFVISECKSGKIPVEKKSNFIESRCKILYKYRDISDYLKFHFYLGLNMLDLDFVHSISDIKPVTGIANELYNKFYNNFDLFINILNSKHFYNLFTKYRSMFRFKIFHISFDVYVSLLNMYFYDVFSKFLKNFSNFKIYATGCYILFILIPLSIKNWKDNCNVDIVLYRIDNLLSNYLCIFNISSMSSDVLDRLLAMPDGLDGFMSVRPFQMSNIILLDILSMYGLEAAILDDKMYNNIINIFTLMKDYVGKIKYNFGMLRNFINNSDFSNLDAMFRIYCSLDCIL